MYICDEKSVEIDWFYDTIGRPIWEKNIWQI